MTTRASSTSLEYYRVTVTPSPDEDPTGLPVRFAFPSAGQAPATWFAAQWESGGPPYVARLTIGPGGDVVLTEGAYDVYVEITETPEVVRFLADRLEVFSDITVFGSVSELADILGADIDPEDPKANQALRDATNFVRAYTRQTLTLVEDDEVLLDGKDRKGIVLPERAAVDITSVNVVDDLGEETLLDSTAYRVDDAGILWRLDGWVWEWGHGNVAVVYTHGYALDSVDFDLIRTATLEIAASNYANSLVAAGNVEAIQIGSFRETFGAASNTTSSGVVARPPTWKTILDRYRATV